MNEPTWHFLVPLPPRAMSPNRKGHGAEKSPDVLAYRIDVVKAVQAQIATQRAIPAPLERARVTVTAGYSRRKPRKGLDGVWPAGWMQWRNRYRPTDADNFLASCKPLFDALCCASWNPGDCARLVVQDRWPHLISLYGIPPFVEVHDWRDEGVLVRLEELEAA